MNLRALLAGCWHWLRGDTDVIPHWTERRAKHHERVTLEAAGLAGHHFAWSRTIAARYKRRTSEREKVTPMRMRA